MSGGPKPGSMPSLGGRMSGGPTDKIRVARGIGAPTATMLVVASTHLAKTKGDHARRS